MTMLRVICDTVGVIVGVILGNRMYRRERDE